MTSKLISCIIPVFNGARYLREAIESIFNQTYRPLEVIVVDDGSTDDPLSVVTSYGEQVKYLRQAHAGPGAARNLGLTEAHGEFVAFLDADDVWHPEKLERQMARFAARPELGLCITHLQNFWISELQEEAAKLRDHRFMQPLPGYGMQTLVSKRTVFDTIGQFNPQLRMGEDTDWFLRAAEQRMVMEVLPEVLAYRRLHHTNLTRVEMIQGRADMIQVFKASLDRRRRTTAIPASLNLPSPGQGRKI
jgi:glycosyltransferase involved in cell wall biosynthesis